MILTQNFNWHKIFQYRLFLYFHFVNMFTLAAENELIFLRKLNYSKLHNLYIY